MADIPTPQQLDYWYNREQKPIKQIAKTLHTSRSNVKTWLEAAGIPLHAAGMHKRKLEVTPEQWKQMYIDQGITIMQLAEKYETTHEIITRHLLAAGILTRDRGGRKEGHAFLHHYEDLIERRLKEGKRCPEIAREIAVLRGKPCTVGAVESKAGRVGLQLQHGTNNIHHAQTPEAIAKMAATKTVTQMGSGNNNWKGGISTQAKYEFEFTEELKDHVRARDGYRCVSCGSTGTLRMNRNGVAKQFQLSVHHKDGDKANNRMKNLETLCESCHKKADDALRKAKEAHA